MMQSINGERCWAGFLVVKLALHVIVLADAIRTHALMSVEDGGVCLLVGVGVCGGGVDRLGDWERWPPATSRGTCWVVHGHLSGQQVADNIKDIIFEIFAVFIKC